MWEEKRSQDELTGDEVPGQLQEINRGPAPDELNMSRA
jgi:hypothetical protein